MTNEQIAHDLAVSRLSGCSMDVKELVNTYRKYYDEILSELKSETQKPKTAKIISNPF